MRPEYPKKVKDLLIQTKVWEWEQERWTEEGGVGLEDLQDNTPTELVLLAPRLVSDVEAPERLTASNKPAINKCRAQTALSVSYPL